MRTFYLALVCSLLVPKVASARNVEPGKLIGIGAVGPSFRTGSRLGGSQANLTLQAGGEYTFSKNWSAVADVGVGIAGTIPLRLAGGARFRLSDLEWPVSPYAQGQLVLGRLWDVIGANMGFVGVRAGIGADYFLTAQLAVGGLITTSFGTTTAETKAFYGTTDVLAYGAFTF